MPDVREQALAIVREHHVATLAVADPDGPWAAALFYASDGFRLIFVSSSRSRHARAVVTDPRAAVTINDQPADWTTVVGLQLEGQVERLSGRARVAALARYLARFPSIAADPRLAAAFRRVAIYRFEPSRAFVVDNRRFGQRTEVPLDR